MFNPGLMEGQRALEKSMHRSCSLLTDHVFNQDAYADVLGELRELIHMHKFLPHLFPLASKKKENCEIT